MGKYMRKCRGVGGEVAVMEVSQVVGVRTRARSLALASASPAAATAKRTGSKRRKVAGAGGVVQNSYLQLRSRSLVMTPRRTPANSGGSRARCPSPAPDRLSRCSSNASSEVASGSVEDLRPPQRSSDPEVDDELETLPCHFECSRERRETTPSSELRVESGDLESTAGKWKSRRSATHMAAAVVMPPEAEIEDFFAAAEGTNSENLRLFGDKYNYDVANDVPLDGRYEWVRLEP